MFLANFYVAGKSFGTANIIILIAISLAHHVFPEKFLSTIYFREDNTILKVVISCYYTHGFNASSYQN